MDMFCDFWNIKDNLDLFIVFINIAIYVCNLWTLLVDDGFDSKMQQCNLHCIKAVVRYRNRFFNHFDNFRQKVRNGSNFGVFAPVNFTKYPIRGTILDLTFWNSWREMEVLIWKWPLLLSSNSHHIHLEAIYGEAKVRSKGESPRTKI